MCFPALFAAVPAALGGAGAAGAGAAAAAGAGAAAAGTAAAGTSILGTLGTAASVIGTGLSVVGQLQQGAAAKAAANAQAKIGNQMARDAEERGREEEGQIRRKYSAMRGAQIAGFGASGLDPTSGSPLDLIGDTATIGEIDALTVRGNAAREAWGYRANANLAKAQGASAYQGSIWAGLGTAMGGVSTVADRWYRMNNPMAVRG